MEKSVKKWTFFWLAVVTAVFDAWLASWVFTHVPVFKEIGGALGISGLKAWEQCLAFLAYIWYWNIHIICS